jgi:uncharacterized repeat protein (TIGR02543 family)
MSQATQFLIDHRQQFFGGFRFALSHAVEDARDIAHVHSLDDARRKSIPKETGYTQGQGLLRKYINGSVVTLTATPNSGYTFNGWSGSFTGKNNPTNLTVTSNLTVTANFVALAALSVGPHFPD